MLHWLEDEALRQLAFAEPVVRADGLAWGQGWGLETGGGGAFWHWGETLGVRTLAYADVDSRQAIVILTNGEGGMEIAERAFVDATGTRSPIFDAF
jgi:hypothetical protein